MASNEGSNKDEAAAANYDDLRAEIYSYAEEIANIGSWVWNMDTNKAMYSDNMFRLFGMLPGEVEPSFETIPQFVHPEDRPRLLSAAGQLKEGGEPISVAYRIVRRDNEERWLRNRIKLSRNKKGERIVIGVTEDVTAQNRDKQSILDKAAYERAQAEEALHHSEHYLRLLIESAKDFAIFTLDTDGLVTAWNAGAELILGFTEEEILGQPGHVFFVPEDRAVKAPEKEMAKAREEGMAENERWHLRKDGTRFYGSGTVRPLLSSTGELLGYVKIMRDMTERELLARQKDEFIAIASHELKTPVTSIKVYAESLVERFEQTDEGQNLPLMQKLNGQIDRLTALIHDLLDTTKIVEGKLPLQKEEFDLNELIAEQVEVLQRTTSKHRIVFEGENVRPLVADRERIAQALANLLSNAIKYSPDSEDVVVRSQAGEDGVLVSIHDKGIGIPEDMRDKVFDRFFRIANPAVHTYPGMGLGLYITSGIVKRHGGSIWVESKDGEGSTFFFTLPYIHSETE